jgi:hypothetical protein
MAETQNATIATTIASRSLESAGARTDAVACGNSVTPSIAV